MKLDWTDGELAEGLRCYRAEKFFAAHEHWELVWLHLPEPEKAFLQALIQVAAAFHHFQRANLDGATSLLQRAFLRLKTYPPSFGGIAVTTLCEEISGWLQAFEARAPAPDRPFPRICLEAS